MPTYEFTFENCQETFDVRASILEKDEGLTPTCPRCGSQKNKQIISGGSLIRAGGATSFNPPNCDPNAGSGCCG